MEPFYVVEIIGVEVDNDGHENGANENDLAQTKALPLRSGNNAANRPSSSRGTIRKGTPATAPAPVIFGRLSPKSEQQFIKTIQATQQAQFRQTELLDLIKSELVKTQHQAAENSSTLTVHESRLNVAEGQIEQLSQKQLATDKTLGDLQVKVDALCDGVPRGTLERNAEGLDDKAQAGASASVAKETYVGSSGRKRKLCTFCGQYFSTTYVKKHEAKGVCLRRLGPNE